MSETKMKIDIIRENNVFIKRDGKYDLKKSLDLGGVFAGECYDEEGFFHLVNEPEEKTSKRIDRTINNGHHSVYAHNSISFNMENVPKMIAMIINNEKEYNTSEKSGRYTLIKKGEGDAISDKEIEIYNKWVDKLQVKIKEEYGEVLNDSKIKKLAQENSRYLLSIFMPTKMVYSTSLRQINYIASWMKDYIDKHDERNSFESRLSKLLIEFCECLDNTGVLLPALMKNEKQRKLSLFNNNLDKRIEYYGDIYLTKYKASFVEFAQALRHRTLDYEMSFPNKNEYYLPPILDDDKVLSKEWINDISSLGDVYPQGMLVNVCESGKYEDFILKCKERLCSSAQVEIMIQTKDTLKKYKNALEKSNHYLYEDIIKYTKGSRCTFPGYVCTELCNFKEGIKGTRRI